MLSLALFALAASAAANMRFTPGFDGQVIDAQLRAELASKSATGAFVKLWGSAGLDGAAVLGDKTAKANFVHETLSSFAAESQANLIELLESRGIRYRSFWIVNSVFIYEATLDLVEELAERSDVEVIRANREAELHVPVSEEEVAERTARLEWNIAMVGADNAWAMGFTGEGVLVAGIDTGVRWTHESLIDSYAGSEGNHDYFWYDPNGALEPFDNNGHGTHTMGSIAGGLGIGVAYGAKWIAAKGCSSSSCSTFDLTASAEFVACPTRADGSLPDCSRTPDVVNNSWGGGQGDTWYESLILAWRAADIAPIFSAGNSGSGCSTANSPADNVPAISVGSTDSSDRLSSFSSRGPGRIVDLKPDVSAPGSAVRSATQTSDSSYSALSGTSMAAPHVAGAYALLKQASPRASIDGIMEALYQTAEQDLLAPTGATECGGLSYDTYPNYHYGHGRIQVDDALSTLLQKEQ